MDLRETIKKEIALQRALIAEYEEKISTLPSGNLVCATRGNSTYYYLVGPDGRRIYLHQANQEQLMRLQLCRTLQTAIKRMKNNIRLGEKILQKYLPYDLSTVQAALGKAYRIRSKTGAQTIGRQGRAIADDEHVHITSGGLAVRSKTELMIVEILNERKIPFIYEKPLRLKIAAGQYANFYPDFVFQTRYGEEIYWEHFGMLGEEEYRKRTLSKLRIYMENGIVPSVNLMVTAENFDGTLDVAVLLRTIDMISTML